MPNSVIDYILDSRWAITPAALSAIIDIVSKNVNTTIDPKIFHKSDYEVDPKDANILLLNRKNALLKNEGTILDGTLDTIVRDRVAIIPVLGPIFPRANLLTSMSGATSLQDVSNDFNIALNDTHIQSIIFDIDSPGGLLTDLDAFAEMVFKAQAQKPIISFVTGLAASAAFWIASATSEIIAARTGEVGSIGVIATARDTSEKDQKAGVQNIDIISSISPLKRTDLKTEEGRKGVQNIVNELGMIFVGTVARNRGTNSEDVINNYGKGDVMLAKDALTVGMIDGIDTLESIINRENEKSNSTMGGMFMPKLISEGNTQDVKLENPSVYNAILEEGKSSVDLEAAKAEGKKEGITAENDRIKGIEALDDGENSKLINDNKFNTEMNKGDVAILIQEGSKEKIAAAAKKIKDDDKDLNDKSTKIDSTQDGDDIQNQRVARSKRMADAMNEKRGLKTK